MANIPSDEVVSLKEFVDGMRGGCDSPGCTHDHGTMFLHSRCHPHDGTFVQIDTRALVMRVTCARCRKPIIAVDIDPAKAKS